MDGKKLLLPCDQEGFQSLVGKLSRSLGFASIPTKVYGINWLDYKKQELIVYSDGILHAAVLSDIPELDEYTHEIIIYNNKHEKIAFSLMRTKGLEESKKQINQFKNIFAHFVETAAIDYTSSMMQKVLDAVLKWPHFNTSHIAVNLGLSQVLKNEAVKSTLEEADEQDGSYPIHMALELRNKTVIDTLLGSGISLDVTDKKGTSPMHIVVPKSVAPKQNITTDIQIALKLLSMGANPNLVDVNGNTPLHFAAKIVSIPLVQGLLAFGADVNVVNKNKETPRHIVSSMATHSDRDKAIFVLHTVGAKRCQQKLASCTQGCLLDGYSNGTPLVADPPLQRSRWVFDEYLAKQQVLQTTEDKKPSAIRGRVLCLDGGGIKGLVLCQQLFVVEEFIGRPIHECFDWITGTSTGSFFAINLALGRSIKHTQCTYFNLKETIFVGSRPYSSDPLESLLKKEFGEERMMNSIKNVKLNLMTTLGDRLPADLHIFRNYEAPIDILSLEENDKFVIPPPAEKQPIWFAARASGAAPTYFAAPDKYVDGGLIANNPVLDTLTEIEERNMALKSVGREKELFHPTLVVSIGCGKEPTKQIADVDFLVPTLSNVMEVMPKSLNAAYNMMTMLVDEACSTEGRTVDRARAWCTSRQIPYFRFNPNMTESCALDECDDKKLVNMMWEARSYMMTQTTLLEQLKSLLRQ